MRFSRRAQQLIKDGSFHNYTRGVAFPKTLLHPSIADEVWLDLARGDLSTAVFKACRQVEIAVRSKGKFAATDVGTQLMRKAFGAQGPLTDPTVVAAEAEGLSNLFTGLIGSYKNAVSHRSVELTDISEAQEIVVMASHLLRIVDSRQQVE